MSSKKITKKIISPDPIYNNIVLAKFINQVMRNGKKSLARKIVYGSLDIIKDKTKKESIEIFEKALENAAPRVEVRSRRVGGATYQVPIPVKEDRSLTLAMRWIIQAAKSQKGKAMEEKLAEELINASENTGAAVKKRENVHKMAQANRAFAHFAR